MPEETSAPKPPAGGFRLEHASHISQIVASIAVIVSLVYVGIQLQQNTAQLRRAENNATETQFQAIRVSIYSNPEVAKLLTDGLYGRNPLDAAGALRLETFLSEFTWSSFHVWDRARGGFLDKEEFTRGAATNLSRLLCTSQGGAWWSRNKVQFVEGFAKDVDTAIGLLPREACPDYVGPAPGRANG